MGRFLLSCELVGARGEWWSHVESAVLGEAAGWATESAGLAALV